MNIYIHSIAVTSLPLYIGSACTYDDTAGRISFFILFYPRTLASCLNTSVRELQLKRCDLFVVAAAALPLTTAAAWPLTSRIEHCLHRDHFIVRCRLACFRCCQLQLPYPQNACIAVLQHARRIGCYIQYAI